MEKILPFGVDSTIQAEKERCPLYSVGYQERLVIDEHDNEETQTVAVERCLHLGLCSGNCPRINIIARQDEKISQLFSGEPKKWQSC